MLTEIKKIFFPFSNRNLQVLYFAKAVSLFGTVLSLLAIPLFIYHHTESGRMLALTSFFEAFGATVGGFFLSHFADRFAPKQFLILLDCIAAFLIMFLLGAFHLSTYIVYLTAFGVGVCGALYLCSTSKLITSLEKDQQKLRYIEGRYQVMGSILQCATPAIGGILLQFISLRHILLIDFFSYLFSALILTRLMADSIGLQTTTTYPKSKWLRNWFDKQIQEPLTYIKNSKVHQNLFLIVFLCAAAIGAGNAVYIYHVKSYLAGSDIHISLLLSLSFGASFISALIVDRLKFNTFKMIFSCTGIMFAAYCGLALAKGIWVFILCYSFVDFMNVIYIVYSRAFLQSATDSPMIGRLRGFMSALSSSGSLLAMLLVSIVITHVPSPYIYLFASLLFFMGSFVGLFAQLKRKEEKVTLAPSLS